VASVFGKSLRGSYRLSPELFLLFSLHRHCNTIRIKLFEREIQWYIAQDTQIRAISRAIANEEFLT